MGQAITRSACRIWGARGFGKCLKKRELQGSRGYEEVGLRCRDTGKSAEKGVSRTGFDRKEVECCSDTGNFGEKNVSRTG